MIDRKYHDQEQANRIWDDQVLKLLEDVPCRADFYRWVLWHDMAFAMTTDMQIPVHIIHYEDYETNFNKTVGDLVQFLQVETVGEPDTFKKGLRYKDYFTKEQQKKVGLAAKQLALPATWNNIKHYFDIK
eukprot:CAMPEP_0202460706 /NCGR_PEP_ID=MMETSP1360-20130828/45453_1 /ASSEMBLY_ACC=CAM_ASM_000848 /TAXON_ID=515479 /ORGANISM="Licmophora paradoxa, Strain CCMP2313" /LENGTH=129 /DNA_ID=CAMNT_0049082475 /DNA_START=247 /DNA_END=636 /DNA_ORIENTATION=-